MIWRMVGILMIALASTTGLVIAQDMADCVDGDPEYADFVERIGGNLSNAGDGDLLGMIAVANESIDTLVRIEPPTAFDDVHVTMIGMLHYMGMAALAAESGNLDAADAYRARGQEYLAEFRAQSDVALAACFGTTT